MSHSEEYGRAVDILLELLGLESGDPLIDKVDIFVDAVIAASHRVKNDRHLGPEFEKSYEAMTVEYLNSCHRSWHHFNIIGSPFLDQDDGSIDVLVEIFREIEEPHGDEWDGIGNHPGDIPF